MGKKKLHFLGIFKDPKLEIDDDQCREMFKLNY